MSSRIKFIHEHSPLNHMDKIHTMIIHNVFKKLSKKPNQDGLGNLPIPLVCNPLAMNPPWNKVDNYIITFHFCEHVYEHQWCFYLFHANDQVFKEIWSFFDNYLCKVQLKLVVVNTSSFYSNEDNIKVLIQILNPFVIIPFQNLCPFFIHGNYIFRHSLTWWFSLWECQTWSWIFHSFSYILLLMIWRTMVWRKKKMSFTSGLALVPCQNPILKGHSKLPKRFTFSMSIPLSKLFLC
jgi:hypothetical protein